MVRNALIVMRVTAINHCARLRYIINTQRIFTPFGPHHVKTPLLLGLTLLSASLFTGQPSPTAPSPTSWVAGHPPRPRHPRCGSAASDAQPAGTTACRRGYRRRLKQLAETARAAVRPLYARDRATGDPGRSHPVNIESLLALRPQVVFVANYAPPAMIAQIQQAGIPVVAISLRHDAAGEKIK